MKTLTGILVVAAAIRWGIIGFLGFDFIGSVFGSAPVTISMIDRIICAVIGIAGLYGVYLLIKGANTGVV